MKGIHFFSDGRKYDGEWVNNTMHGKGVLTWKDGRKYDGTFANDKRHGYGMYTWADGRKYEGPWLNGKQHGQGKYILPNGQVSSGIWENGTRTQWIDGNIDTKIMGNLNQGGLHQTTTDTSTQSPIQNIINQNL